MIIMQHHKIVIDTQPNQEGSRIRMGELERSKCMVKASCYTKFLPPSFGGLAAGFSSNYGFYAKIPSLMAPRQRKTSGLRIPTKEVPGKTLARSFREI